MERPLCSSLSLHLLPPPQRRAESSSEPREGRKREAQRGCDEQQQLRSLSRSPLAKLPSPPPPLAPCLSLACSLSSFSTKKKERRSSRRAKHECNFLAPFSPLSALAHLLGPRLLGLGDIDSGQGGHEVADVAQGAVEFFVFRREVELKVEPPFNFRLLPPPPLFFFDETVSSCVRLAGSKNERGELLLCDLPDPPPSSLPAWGPGSRSPSGETARKEGSERGQRGEKSLSMSELSRGNEAQIRARREKSKGEQAHFNPYRRPPPPATCCAAVRFPPAATATSEIFSASTTGAMVWNGVLREKKKKSEKCPVRRSTTKKEESAKSERERAEREKKNRQKFSLLFSTTSFFLSSFSSSRSSKSDAVPPLSLPPRRSRRGLDPSGAICAR